MPVFKRLLALFRLRQARKSRQQLRREKFKRGKAMGKRMTGKAKKTPQNSKKGTPKNAKKRR